MMAVAVPDRLVAVTDWLVAVPDRLVAVTDWLVAVPDWLVAVADWLVATADWQVALMDRRRWTTAAFRAPGCDTDRRSEEGRAQEDP